MQNIKRLAILWCIYTKIFIISDCGARRKKTDFRLKRITTDIEDEESGMICKVDGDPLESEDNIIEINEIIPKSHSS